MLHNHDEMIELNPLVIEHHPIKTPRDAPADEFLDCVWQELTDKIHYLPGGIVKGKVSYKACFHDTPYGLQTHIYAPMGLDIREKWSIGGSLPGEPPETRELGVDTPRQGLYLREDGDMRCNILLTSFVRKNLDNAHKVLVERILKKAERVEEHHQTVGYSMTPTSPRFQAGSHMSNSQFIHSPPLAPPLSPQMLSPQQDLGFQVMANHPAFRVDDKRPMSTYSLPPYQAQNQRLNYYSPDLIKQQLSPAQEPARQFMAELPGSTYHTGHLVPPQSPPLDHRMSMATELSGSEVAKGSPNRQSQQSQSDRGSVISDTPPGQYKYNPQDFTSANQSVSGVSERSNRLSELPSSIPNPPYGQQLQQPR